MKIIFYDVEHGSCCHIITPNGKHILVDVGSKTDKSVVKYIVRKYFNGQTGKIDQLIITHPHEDHLYDLPNLCSLLPPKVLSRSKGAFDIVPTKNTELHRRIANCANQMNRDYNSPISHSYSPTNPSNNGGVDIDIIYPPVELTTKQDLNTFSSIIVVKYEGYKFVLTGDNPCSILNKIMNENYDKIRQKVENAVVLLAPHHGRTGEYCESFFKCVNPTLTVVSDKSIVHETQIETAKLYKGSGAHLYGEDRYVLTTRSDGTIKFEIDNNNCTVSLNKEGY